MRISLEDAAVRLRRGEIVAIPTETVYGLAADASNDKALQAIFATKQRPADHPLIVHIADISQVADWAACFPEAARALALAFWPGALTLILPAKHHVSAVLRAGEPTIALRVPNHPMTLALLKLAGLSVAAPSANLFTQLSPTTAQHVEASLGEHIPVLDGGPCQVGIESTIVSVAADGHWQLLRPGMISEDDIARVLGKTKQDNTASLDKPTAEKTRPKAPGQHALHYSPRTPVFLFQDRIELVQTSIDIAQAGLKCAALLIGEGEQAHCPLVQLSNLPAVAAEKLYSALHELDALKLDRLLVELPPDTPVWAAVLDRLNRAGHRGS